MIKPKTTLGSVLAGQQQGTAVDSNSDSNSSSQRLAAAGGSTRARCQPLGRTWALPHLTADGRATTAKRELRASQLMRAPVLVSAF